MDPDVVEEQKAGASHVEIHETPLNWPLWKRNTVFFVVCLTAFAATNTILANAAGLVIQAQEYQKSAKDVSYTLSATLAGATIGPFVWQPLARKYGKAFTIFTASNLLWIFNIWAAICRGKESYGSFIGARAMSGFASSAAAYVGGPIILELYPLHNRGKAFGVWSFSLMFGAAGITNVLAVFLQTPVSHGGYGLNAKQNSNFLFSQWVGTLLALVYSALWGDRLPLWLYKRNGGQWIPEYRLISLLLPCLVVFPIGYVVMGVSLARHYNLAILGLAACFLAGATALVMGSLVAYLTETFLRYRSEANVTANLARLALGIAIPFFVFPWEEEVGLEWMFGMIGVFQWVCFVPLLVLYSKGETIRKWALSSVADPADEEEGEMIINGGH
ncbi:major facilitator superfamily domain-containing protein [Aspergillus floccosus]